MTAAGNYEAWLKDVEDALSSINMAIQEWQQNWHFDFEAEFKAGAAPKDAAMRANQFWWHQQNKTIGKDCRKNPNCWLPLNHSGECQRR